MGESAHAGGESGGAGADRRRGGSPARGGGEDAIDGVEDIGGVFGDEAEGLSIDDEGIFADGGFDGQVLGGEMPVSWAISK